MPAQDVLVIGLGYVGLPLAVQAVGAGFRVTGYDTSAAIAAGLNAGRSHVDDVSDREVAVARNPRARAAATCSPDTSSTCERPAFRPAAIAALVS